MLCDTFMPYVFHRVYESTLSAVGPFCSQAAIECILPLKTILSLLDDVVYSVMLYATI